MSCHPFCNQTGRENGKGDTEITIISFFVFRDIYVLYYAIEESDDVIGGATKTV